MAHRDPWFVPWILLLVGIATGVITGTFAWALPPNVLPMILLAIGLFCAVNAVLLGIAIDRHGVTTLPLSLEATGFDIYVRAPMFSPRLILFLGLLLNYLFYIISTPEVWERWPAAHFRPLLLFGIETGATVIGLTAFSFLFVFLFHRLFRLGSMKGEAFRTPAKFITGITFTMILLANVQQYKRIQIANRPNENQEKSQSNASHGNLEIYPYQSGGIQGNLYRNRQFSFRMVFPEHWQIKRGDGPNIVVKAVENTGRSINIWVRDIDAYLSADDIPSSLLLESAKEAFPDAKLIDSGSTHINNKPAKYIVYDASYSVPIMRVKLRMISYWVINSQKLFVITGGAEPEQFANYKAIIDLAVSTLIFEDGFY